jgi:hypothetical protein
MKNCPKKKSDLPVNSLSLWSQMMIDIDDVVDSLSFIVYDINIYGHMYSYLILSLRSSLILKLLITSKLASTQKNV